MNRIIKKTKRFVNPQRREDTGYNAFGESQPKSMKRENCFKMVGNVLIRARLILEIGR